MDAEPVHLAEEAEPGPTRRPARPILTAIIVAVVSALVIAATVREGQRRGLDHTIDGLENNQWAIAVALSDMIYHLNAGYVGYATVYNKLIEIWYRGATDVHDPIIEQKNDKDRDLMNEALRAAASLGPQQPGYVGDRTLINLVYSDVGIVDFDKLAFRVFGLRIESLYYTFFLLLAMSAAAYLLVFWNDLGAKITLLFALFSFLIEPFTLILSSPQMPTYPGPRHGSTLVLIPALHFAFLVLRRRRLSIMAVCASLVQLAILSLAISIRVSASWALFFVVAAAFWVAFRDRLRQPKGSRSWSVFVRNVACWPVILLLGGFFGYNQYVKFKLHPVYFTDDVMPYHGFWHSTYIGLLTAHMYGLPGFISSNSIAPQVARNQGFDAAGYVAALEYLRDSHFIRPPDPFPGKSIPPGFYSDWSGAVKWKLEDDIMRRVVTKIWLRHPLLTLRLYALYNPGHAIQAVSRAIEGAPTRTWLWLLILGGLTGLGIVWAGGRAAEVETAWCIVSPILAAIPFAALPNIMAYSQFHTIADLFLVTLALLQVLVCAVAVLIANGISMVWSPGAVPQGQGTPRGP